MVMNAEVESKAPKLELLEGSEPVSRRNESEERIKNAEARIRGLEAEIEIRKSEYKELEGKYKALELRKLDIEDELKSLKARKVEEDDDELFQLKVENVTLECEKKKAESEVEIWKRKYHELKSMVGRITDKIEYGYVPAAGATCDISRTPCSNLPNNVESLFGGENSRGRSCRKARRHLFFEKEKDSIMKMAPSTPTDPKGNLSGIINIDDSDDEPNNSDEEVKALKTSLKSRVDDLSLDDDMNVCIGNNPCATTPKRKRAANVVATDSESEDDDIPLSQLKAKRFRKVSFDANGLSQAASPSASDDDDNDDDEDVRDTVTPRRRRLKRMGESRRKSDAQQLASSETNCGSKDERGIRTTADGAEDSTADEEEGSGSSDDSMKEFIVESSDTSSGDTCSTEDSADIGVEMKDIVSKLQRSRNRKFNWESVGEMQSDFGKDNELCMRAVCALYRQQTSDEQVAKNTFHSNKRGFSQSHAPRASKIAAFLIDSTGDLSKSVEELRAYDPKAVDKCRDWALHYANQLFNIYKSGEDPFFPPAVDNK
ncbi:unnamed protein product [Linum tenue]|uniref:Uncharacterized protein n=1 Tax=Linum tenue TaxID=586396 RepID=A0AAV0JUN3_9ROSI|nr:unnamed protein product [Linum tenue]